MNDALSSVHEITKLIKKSPKRDSQFKVLKDQLAPGTRGVRILCPTRWTIRADSLSSILDNYQVLQELWEEVLPDTRDTEMRARIIGVSTLSRTS